MSKNEKNDDKVSSPDKKCNSNLKQDNAFVSLYNFLGSIVGNIVEFIKNIFKNKKLLNITSIIIVSVLINVFTCMTCSGKLKFAFKTPEIELVKSKFNLAGLLRITFILAIIATIVLIIMYYIEYYNTNPVLVKNINAKKGSVVINNSKLMKSYEGVQYSYSFWMYIDNWSYRYNKPKWLLYKCDTPKDEETIPLSNPTIVLNSKEPKLFININTSTEDGATNETLTTPNLEVQKWNHIVLTLKNQDVRVYCNGELCVGKRLKGTVVLNDNDLYVVPYGGYSGMLHYLQYFNYQINMDKVKKIYSDKPSDFSLKNVLA